MSGRKKPYSRTSSYTYEDDSDNEAPYEGEMKDNLFTRFCRSKKKKQRCEPKPASVAPCKKEPPKPACPPDKKQQQPACPPKKPAAPCSPAKKPQSPCSPEKKPACPEKKPACPKPKQPACPKPKSAPSCPKRSSSQSSCRRKSRKQGARKPRSRNPFIIFFLEKWFKKPCGRVAVMAKEAGKQWACLPDKDKDVYRKLACREQLRQRRAKARCGKKRHHSRKSSKCRKAKRHRRPKRC